MPVAVRVQFNTTTSQRFLIHDGAFVSLNGSGNGTIQAEENEFELILFGIDAPETTEATITLTPPSTHRLEIAGHPIRGRVAKGKTRWGDNRFFRLKPV